MASLIKDLIEIPERVRQGDFVLRLTEGVTHAEQTLADYVVTSQLVKCFDNALGFIGDALRTRSSKAAYLHGSFGSGKSHFMAVLHLFLNKHPKARSIPELAPLIASHDAWMEKHKLLMVPYHLIGARDLESAILGHYAEHIAKLHPDAPVPGVFAAEALFRDAQRLRQKMGDDAFFSRLNEVGTQDGADAWGALSAAWTPGGFDAALAASPASDERARLVGDLVQAYFTSYAHVATEKGAFVPLDQGLSVISKHAASLGYTGVILFLDELILWLASHVADTAFVNREVQKVTKLVEAQQADRPIPLISFLARQRDLRELVGDHLPGAEQQTFLDTLRWWEGRFFTITLEDRNLAEIAEKRVLKPKSPAARQELDHAFSAVMNVREEALRTLLTETADRETFRKVYPFSPALVQALVALSSVLQRERTALKVMFQLLVNHRETLEVQQIVPVGDLFEVLAHDAEPFSSEMRVHFEHAVKLYRQKLLPLLEQQYGITQEQAGGLEADDPKLKGFRADDAIVKTLLLAALVPEVACFQNLNAGRLDALNLGLTRAPLRGQEAALILGKVRSWAAQVGEIKVSEDAANPEFAVQLTGVDTKRIMEKALSHDTPGGRQRKVREMLFHELDIVDREALFTLTRKVTWRGTLRDVEVAFGNVRTMNYDQLAAGDGCWRVVIDYPFDEEGRTPADDLSRLEELSMAHPATQTLSWLPDFLNAKAKSDLGKLVILDYILASDDRFRSYSSELSEVERAEARTLLDNQRSQIRESIRLALEAAYGINKTAHHMIDETLTVSTHFFSMWPTFQARHPVGANLLENFEHLVAQCLAHQFPANPDFEVAIKPIHLKKVLDLCVESIQAENHRLVVDKSLRPTMRQIANPLKLGEMHESAFILSQHWRNHFERKISIEKDANGAGEITVRKMRAWMDEPQPMGLPSMVGDLVILVFAELTNRTFQVMNRGIVPEIGKLPDEAILKEQELPKGEVWEEAQAKAARIFGIHVPPLLNGSNVATLIEKVLEKVEAGLKASIDLAGELNKASALLGLEAPGDRQKTADAGAALMRKLRKARELEVVKALADVKPPTSDIALGTSISKAGQQLHAITNTKWKLLESIGGLEGGLRDSAEAILAKLREAFACDELAMALDQALKKAEDDAARLLASLSTAVSTKADGFSEQPATSATPQKAATHKKTDLTLHQAKSLIDDLERSSRDDDSLRLDISWRQDG